MSKPPAKTRTPRLKFGDVSSDFDPNKENSNRVFEITRYFTLAEDVIEKRIRIRVVAGGLEDNVYEVGDQQCYCGMISELRHTKWTPYGWGHVPMFAPAEYQSFTVREVFPSLESQQQPAATEAEPKT